MTINEEQKVTIEDVRKQFEQCRQTIKKRSVIPDHFWEAAIALSKYHSPSKISQALRLDYSDLKKRIERSRSEHLPETIQPKFRQLWTVFSGWPKGSVELFFWVAV
jgi:hypothetical protein